jgi:hypothetical protein
MGSVRNWIMSEQTSFLARMEYDFYAKYNGIGEKLDYILAVVVI